MQILTFFIFRYCAVQKTEYDCFNLDQVSVLAVGTALVRVLRSLLDEVINVFSYQGTYVWDFL